MVRFHPLSSIMESEMSDKPQQVGIYEVDIQGVIDPAYSKWDGEKWRHCALTKETAESLSSVPSKLTINNWRSLPENN